MPRLFTAIELPEALREDLSALEAPLPGAHWTHEDNLHITLRFAGDIDNRTADEFAAELSGIDLDSFTLRISGVGAFGGNGPRILYAGVAPSPQLEALARAHERAARNAGLEPEKRTFKAHVTLARMRRGRGEAVARWLQRHARFSSGPFAVTRFLLMSSRPKTGGGPYVEEAAYPLQGGAAFLGVDAESGY
jgi:RNA 2',3'-cyclic 3'-phosphodiesterase